MNRPIKFRVWDKANNKFINPFLFERDDYYKTTGMVLLDLNGKIRIADYSSGNGDNSASSVYSEVDNSDNYIIQEYTGLTDKNGKEIYEGDIIEQNFGEKPTRGLVKFSRGSFRVIWPAEPYDDLGCMLIEYVTVIGNVFENPKMRGIYE